MLVADRPACSQAEADLPPLECANPSIFRPAAPRSRLTSVATVHSSLNLWPYISGTAPHSPRTQVLLGDGGKGINGIVVAEADGSIWKRLEGTINEAG